MRGVAHSSQKITPDGGWLSQAAQIAAKGFPRGAQNLPPVRFSCQHCEQRMCAPCWTSMIAAESPVRARAFTFLPLNRM